MLGDATAGQRPASRLLLVEDDTGIGRLLERGLTGEGYQVTWARDLRTARGVAQKHPYDIAILDRMLPDGDGAEFCSELRAQDSQLAVLVLTARETLEDKLSGYEAGADDYLTKPFEFDELLVRINALLRRARRNGDTAPQPELDDQDRSLKVGMRRLRFTKREWPLFCHLFQNAGTPQSRADLIRNAWDSEGEMTENNVDVYVGYLRRKLAKAGMDIRIETVRGIGYVLVK